MWTLICTRRHTDLKNSSSPLEIQSNSRQRDFLLYLHQQLAEPNSRRTANGWWASEKITRHIKSTLWRFAVWCTTRTEMDSSNQSSNCCSLGKRWSRSISLERTSVWCLNIWNLAGRWISRWQRMSVVMSLEGQPAALGTTTVVRITSVFWFLGTMWRKSLKRDRFFHRR